jgi:hypothetical protein
MAEGLRILGSCSKCGGSLSFADAPRDRVGVGIPDELSVERTAPHLVLGLPRR